MRYRFLILLLGISGVISAQINYKNSSWFIKGNASSLIDIFTFPTLQFSAEKQITEYTSICPEIGYQLYNFNKPDTSFLHPSGFKANIEFRYYLSKFVTTRLSNSIGRLYTGIRPFYSQNKLNSTISYRKNTDPVIWIDDDFGVKNTTYGANVIFGFQKAVTERLILDMNIGLGVANRTVTNSNLQYSKDAGYLLAGTEIIKYFKVQNLSESSGIKASYAFGFRFGYTIYKKR